MSAELRANIMFELYPYYYKINGKIKPINKLCHKNITPQTQAKIVSAKLKSYHLEYDLLKLTKVPKLIFIQSEDGQIKNINFGYCNNLSEMLQAIFEQTNKSMFCLIPQLDAPNHYLIKEIR